MESALYRLARMLLAYEQPADVLERFLYAVCEQLQADAGYLVSRGENGFRPLASVRYQLDDNAELEFSSTAVRHVLRVRTAMVLHDLKQAPWLRAARSVNTIGMRSLACTPILLQSQPVAVLYLERRHKGTGFPAGTARFITEAAELCAGVLARRLGSHPQSASAVTISTPITGITLTPQEERVAAALVTGGSNQQIAELLGISRETVKAHLQHIYVKLGVRNRSAAAFKLAQRPPGDALFTKE